MLFLNHFLQFLKEKRSLSSFLSLLKIARLWGNEISPSPGGRGLTLLRRTPIAPNRSRVPRVSADRRPSVTKIFFKKITAHLVFKIKSSFFSPFLVNGYILSCKCQKCKKIIISYIYGKLCYSENEKKKTFSERRQ